MLHIDGDQYMAQSVLCAFFAPVPLPRHDLLRQPANLLGGDLKIIQTITL
jgi:hypothetical protein